MKYTLIFCIALPITIMLHSCGGTHAFTKIAYLNNDVVKIPNEKVTDITLIAVSYKEDKAMYEIIGQQLQSALTKKAVPSDIRFYDAKEMPSEIAGKIKETTRPYYLVIDKIISGTQKDEMNNDFIVNQVNCMLQKNNGEHIADFTIAIADNQGAAKTGKTVAGVIMDYLKKNNFI